MLGDLSGEIMVFQPMLVLDVSRTGVTVDTRFPLQLDSLHDIRLTLPSGPVVAKARVAHSRISDVDQDVVMYRSGLEFVDVPDRVSVAISAFLERVKDDRTASRE